MRALVAMSGGVDSAVSALLTQRLGWECVGCTMKLTGIAEAGDRTCCTADDAADALALAICHSRAATSLLNTDRVFDPRKYDTR